MTFSCNRTRLICRTDTVEYEKKSRILFTYTISSNSWQSTLGG